MSPEDKVDKKTIKMLYRKYGMDYVEDDSKFYDSSDLNFDADWDDLQDFSGDLRKGFRHKIPDSDNQF